MSFYINFFSRNYFKKLINAKNVYVNGFNKKPSYKVSNGENIEGFLILNKMLLIKAEKIPLEIVYEDFDIMIINKSSGMVVHPSPGHDSGTIVNALLYYSKNFQKMSKTLRPGIVHRLDKDTTGLLIVAKNLESLKKLSYQFKSRIVVKEYLVIVYGVLSSLKGEINYPIGRDNLNRKKMSIRSKKLRSAKTYWKVLKRYGNIASFLKIKLETGRTHQIRVHLESIGFPIIGDQIYKLCKKKVLINLKVNNRMTQVILNIKRQMLHAYKIKLRHPKNDENIVFKSKLPSDMVYLLKELKKHC